VIRCISVSAFAFGAVLALPNVAWAKGCREVSDIVGYEKCHRFGDGWATERRPPIDLGLDLPYMTFDPNGTSFDASKGKNDPAHFTYPGQSLGVKSIDTFGFGLKITGYFLGPLYTGVTFGLTFGRNDYDTVTANGTPLSRSDSAVNTTGFYGGALLGVRLPLGRISLRFETLFGGTSLTIDQHSSVGDYSSTAGHWMIEPRATVDVWIRPNVSLGAYGGINALDAGDRVLGLSLEYHVRSFDGAFALW
jgi:hypothetical protein